MSKFEKRLAPLVLATVMGLSFISLTACGDGKTPTEPVNPGPGIEAPDNPPVNPPIVTPGPEEPGDQIPTEAYDVFVANMGLRRNYTYSVTADGTATIYQIDGDKVCFYEVGSGYETIWYTENGSSYQLKYEDDGYYHKTNIDAFDTDEYILKDMQNANIVSYDEDSEKYIVELDGKQYSATVSDDAVVFDDSNKICVVEAVNKTTFPVIDNSQIKDESSPVKPVDPEKPVVPGDKIYTVDAQGVRTYNSKLLGEILKTAMNTEDESGKTLLNKFSSGVGVSVDDILYVSTEGDTIEIGTVAQFSNNKIIEIFKIEKSSVGEIGDSKEAWVSEITRQTTEFVLGYELIRIDYDASMDAEHQAVLKEVFGKALDKVAVDGVQVSGYNKKGEPKDRYANSEVLAVFEFGDGLDGQAGLDLGYTHRKGLVGIIKDGNGQPVIVSMNVATTNLDSFENTVLNKEKDKNNKFVVYKMDIEQNIDNQFFKEEEKAKNNVAKNVAVLSSNNGKSI